MILPVLKYPDPRLKRKCQPVLEVTPELRALVGNMAETMYARDGIGLAAPQIGEAIRLVVVDISGPEERTELMVLLNPELELVGHEVDSEEGCLSVPEFRSEVVRSSAVRLKATDLEGRPVAVEADGLLAICLQHECDHLEGTLFIDHISRLKRMMLDRKLTKKGSPK